MSYRVRVNKKQIFGNNESYEEWNDFLKSQGIEINDEGCYDGEITDFMGAVKAMEQIVMRIDAEQAETREKLLRSMKDQSNDPETINAKQEILSRYSGLFDLTYIKEAVLKEHDDPRRNEYLFDKLYEIEKNGYLFFPIQLYRACEKDLEIYMEKEIGSRMWTFRLKPGRTIHVHAG